MCTYEYTRWKKKGIKRANKIDSLSKSKEGKIIVKRKRRKKYEEK